MLMDVQYALNNVILTSIVLIKKKCKLYTTPCVHTGMYMYINIFDIIMVSSDPKGYTDIEREPRALSVRALCIQYVGSQRACERQSRLKVTTNHTHRYAHIQHVFIVTIFKR